MVLTMMKCNRRLLVMIAKKDLRTNNSNTSYRVDWRSDDRCGKGTMGGIRVPMCICACVGVRMESGWGRGNITVRRRKGVGNG